MTKTELKSIILETYREVLNEKKHTVVPAKPVAKPVTKPVAKKTKAEPETKITPNFLDKIEKREKANKIKGDTSDVNLLGRVHKILKRRIGQTLEEGDVDSMIAELECDDCWKEDMDPVGKEDSDVNNDGKVDGTDKYLLKRRHAIGNALEKAKKLKK
jgi:hypothetical protein